MKILFVLLLISTNIIAQDNKYELRKLESKVTKEIKSFYIKSGSHILNFNNKKTNASSFSAGIQKKASSLIYGFEMMTIGKKNKFSSESAIVHFGYSPQWNHRANIYLSFQMGIGSLTNLLNDEKSQFFYNGLEFGYLLKRFDLFDIELAMRKNYFNIENDSIQSMESQEILIKMSLEY